MLTNGVVCVVQNLIPPWNIEGMRRWRRIALTGAAVGGPQVVVGSDDVLRPLGIRAAVAVRDARLGEAIFACVVRRDPKLTEAAVIAHPRALLTADKVPRRVIFFDALPKTPVGKVLRRAVREYVLELGSYPQA
jgi:acyl-CoA synthetase (AMP-forming)/AMP-acid ligase II